MLVGWLQVVVAAKALDSLLEKKCFVVFLENYDIVIYMCGMIIIISLITFIDGFF